MRAGQILRVPGTGAHFQVEETDGLGRRAIARGVRNGARLMAFERGSRVEGRAVTDNGRPGRSLFASLEPVGRPFKMVPVDWRLTDAVAQHRRHGASFWIPAPADRKAVNIGDAVKLRFAGRGTAERMWVHVTQAGPRWLAGILDNDPVATSLRRGDRVMFERRHILDIWKAGETRP